MNGATHNGRTVTHVALNRGRGRRRSSRNVALAYLVGAIASARGAVSVAPSADGTLADGGPFGVFDGIVDVADWSFNESSFEGAITLTRPTESAPGLEQRVVWEYVLPGGFQPPVTASLTLRLRGAPRFPAQATVVWVVAYPANALENATDFSAPAAAVVGVLPVAPFQPPTDYRLGVSAVVSDLLRNGAAAIGFRFQVDPATANVTSQAFVDALDSRPETKPTLTLDTAVPADFDNDSDVDRADFKSLTQCLLGPAVPVTVVCRRFDMDLDRDVDLEDAAAFDYFFGFFAD